MRIGNVGIHGSSSHQVTDCVHHHSEQKKETGGMKMSASAPVSVQNAVQETKESYAEWSPVDWLKSLLKRGRSLGLRLWGNDIPGVTEGKGKQRAEGLEAAQLSGDAALHRQKTEEHRTQAEQMPPYFIMPERKEPNQGMIQKLMLKVHTVSGHLAKHLPFAHTGSFQAKQQNKEDLRRRSRYRKEDTEIDCILTDDSYLMDSYNGKGEYSKLSTDNKKV